MDMDGNWYRDKHRYAPSISPGKGSSCFGFHRASRFKFITHRNSSIWPTPVNFTGVAGWFFPRTKAELFNYPTYIDDQGILTRNQLCFRSIRWIQNDFQLGLIWPALSRLEQTTAECHLAV